MAKLAVDPRTDFSAAPSSVRSAYLSMIAVAVILLADGILGGDVIHLFPAGFWSIVFGVIAAYLVADSGLLVLRARTLGRNLGFVVSGGLAVVAVLNFAGVMGQGGKSGYLTSVGLIGLGVMIAGFLSAPASRAHFATRAPAPGTGGIKGLKAKGAKRATAAPDAAAGSFAAMMAAQKAEQDASSQE